MKFATTSELNQQTNTVLKHVLEGHDEIVITKNGKPIAIISPMSEEDLEEHILIKQLGLHQAPLIKERKKAKASNEIFRKIREQVSKDSSESRKRSTKTRQKASV